MSKREDFGLISVIIPYYNNPELFECIDSILNQNYPNIELIIADDGSVENRSKEITQYVQKKQHGNIINLYVLREEKNHGTVYNINSAIKKTSGNPIFTIAADDVLYDNSVFQDWTEMFKKSGADVVFGLCICCDEELTPRYIMPEKRQIEIIESQDNKKIWRELRKSNFILGCATARSSKAIEKYGLIPECYTLIEDFPMNLKWYRLGAKVKLMDHPVVFHRGGGVSASYNVSDIYIQDTKMIYRNEILPYVWNPIWWKIRMKTGIMSRVREGRYLKMRKFNDSFLWNVVCHICFPETMIKFLRTIIKDAYEKNQIWKWVSVRNESKQKTCI